MYNHYDMTWRLKTTNLPVNLVGTTATDSNKIIDSQGYYVPVLNRLNTCKDFDDGQNTVGYA